MAEKYTETALHFEADRLPRLFERHLPTGPLALADLGCGDGPWFRALAGRGYISASRPVYAVDLEADRLARVKVRFPWIETVQSPADSVPEIGDGSLDVVCSTMVMEHVPDERTYLGEIARMLRIGGRTYVTTVFKKSWAWYFRSRDGETVLDPSHLREYTDVDAFRALLQESPAFRVLVLARRQLWFPILDPVLFRVGHRYEQLAEKRSLLRALRAARVPIPGYYSLEAVLERTPSSTP